MSNRLANKTAIVTGAGRGIGRGIAQVFAQEGANVVAVSRTSNEVEAVASEIQEIGQQALAITADMTQLEDVERMTKTALAEFGQIDILVTAAGMNAGGSITETPVDRWDEIINVNLKGVYLCCHVVAPHMKAQRSGRIITISSLVGKIGDPWASVYGVSKWGVIGLTKSLAAELRPFEVNVNTICPGIVQTPGTDEFFPHLDHSEWQQPEDVANLAVFLASDEAKWIRGADIDIGELVSPD